jgi:VCBS repeat-containing protein
MASISGLVWDENCQNYSLDETLPSGCVLYGGDPDFIGNGVLEDGEAGISSVQISLGKGMCPSSGLAATTTDKNGRFSFASLEPGEYCVTVIDPTNRNFHWTYPKDAEGHGVGYFTISLNSGEAIENINFGLDRIETQPTPEPTAAPTSAPCVNQVGFIRDVSVPDGTRFDPGESFTKTWRFKNEGTCTWNSSYALVFISGYPMQAAYTNPLLGEISPGFEVDLSIEFQAPMEYGDYAGFWKLRDSEGNFFGIGSSGNSPLWVQISVGPVPEPEITEWRGEYFDNSELKGDPTLIRNDEEIDFDWKTGSPDKAISADSFSVRWTRTMEFDAGMVRFHLLMDDGAVLWVDDRLVIDEWKQGATREIELDLYLEKGDHDFKVEYYEAGSQSVVQFWWEELDELEFEGWKGTYWFNKSLDSSWALIREDEAVKFNWVFESPVLGIPVDAFSVQWEKSVEFEPGDYVFSAYADDGIRVYIDDAIVIDEWHRSNGSELYQTELQLSGTHELTVQYYEGPQHAKVLFEWERKNEVPEATDDDYSVDMNTLLFVDSPGVLANDADADGDPLVAVLEVDAINGTLVLNEDGSFEYAPDADFVGEDGFQYRVNDGQATSEIATVTIDVLLVNQRPQALEDNYEMDEDEVLTVPVKGVLANDNDADGHPITAVLEIAAEFGIVELAQDGSFVYTPDPDFNGVDTFTYKANDGYEDSEVALVTIVVASVNDVPQAEDDQATLENGVTIEIDVLKNDKGIGDSPIELAIELEPEFGDVEIIDGLVLYTPRGSFLDIDAFQYKVTDLDGESSVALVSVIRVDESFNPE